MYNKEINRLSGNSKDGITYEVFDKDAKYAKKR
jgi:hypothetical protein